MIKQIRIFLHFAFAALWCVLASKAEWLQIWSVYSLIRYMFLIDFMLPLLCRCAYMRLLTIFKRHAIWIISGSHAFEWRSGILGSGKIAAPCWRIGGKSCILLLCHILPFRSNSNSLKAVSSNSKFGHCWPGGNWLLVSDNGQVTFYFLKFHCG